jgi:hypothetical protein
MTFLDAAVPALLDGSPELVTLLFTCVGVGEYDSKPGGPPGRPSEVTQVVPRLSGPTGRPATAG